MALQYATILVSALLASSSLLLRAIDPFVETSTAHRQLSKCILLTLYIALNGFVQLLYTQHWSFISSILSETEGATWFAPIAGLGSAVTTALSWLILPLVDEVGLTGMLLIASLLLSSCGVFSGAAYSVSASVSVELAWWVERQQQTTFVLTRRHLVKSTVLSLALTMVEHPSQETNRSAQNSLYLIGRKLSFDAHQFLVHFASKFSYASVNHHC